MRKKKSLVVFLILLILLFVSLLFVYTKLKTPLEIIDLQAFHIDKSHGKIAFYIDCRNMSHKKTVDSFFLSVICNSDEQAIFQCRILEPEGILPQENHEFRVELSESELPIKDIATLEVSVSQVNFTDGSKAEKCKIQKPIVTQVDGNIGTGMFPVKINEAFVYEESPTPQSYKPIHFQIDWSNISEESIIGVTYKVTAKTIDGTTILSENGDDAVYISEFYEKPDEWIQPLTDNNDVNKEITANNSANVLRDNGAAIYEVSVCRAVTSKGVIWENTNENDRIVVAIGGKKGYGFNEDPAYPSIQSMVERIDKESQKYEINLCTPVFL